MSYVLTITRHDGSTRTLTVSDEAAAHKIAYMWDKEMGYKTTSEPPIEFLGVQKHTPERPKERRQFRPEIVR